MMNEHQTKIRVSLKSTLFKSVFFFLLLTFENVTWCNHTSGITDPKGLKRKNNLHCHLEMHLSEFYSQFLIS